MAESTDRKVMTLDDLKTLIGQEAERIVLAKGFVPLGELKDKVRSELETYVEANLKPAFEAEIKRLRNLPGPGGQRDLGAGEDGALKGISPTAGYECLAEFAKDVYLAGKQGARPSTKFGKWQTDLDLFREAVKVGSPSLEISDPEQGGYLIPPGFSTTLLDRGIEESNFLDRCTKVPMERNQVGMPFIKDFDHTTYLNGAMQGYWIDELGAKTPSKPKFGKVTLSLNKLVVMVYSSDELLEDSPISMEPLLMQKSGDVIAWKIDEAIYRGTGAGQPLGILNAPAHIAVPAEGGQGGSTIVFENLVKMYSRLYPKSFAKSVWVANSDTFPQLATVNLAVGVGGAPAWLPANGLSGLPYNTLFGKEIIWSEQASALGTEGDIALVDFSQYLLGQKRGAGAGVQFAKSIHLYFNYDQTAFRYVIRLDGQPWWPTVFTPKRGATQSPFITLATRT